MGACQESEWKSSIWVVLLDVYHWSGKEGRRKSRTSQIHMAYGLAHSSPMMSGTRWAKNWSAINLWSLDGGEGETSRSFPHSTTSFFFCNRRPHQRSLQHTVRAHALEVYIREVPRQSESWIYPIAPRLRRHSHRYWRSSGELQITLHGRNKCVHASWALRPQRIAPCTPVGIFFFQNTFEEAGRVHTILWCLRLNDQHIYKWTTTKPEDINMIVIKMICGDEGGLLFIYCLAYSIEYSTDIL